MADPPLPNKQRAKSGKKYFMSAVLAYDCISELGVHMIEADGSRPSQFNR